MNIKGQGYSLTLVQGHSDSTFSNFFSWKTVVPIEAKFHVELKRDRGTKVCSNGLGHMTKVAAMSTYGKNMKHSSSLEPKSRWPWKLHAASSAQVQMITLGWPWPILWQGQIWSPVLLEKVKTMDFSETIVVCDIKVSICSQLNEYMKLYGYQRSRSLTDLGPNLSDSIFLISFPK